jgi:hypothetical protein
MKHETRCLARRSAHSSRCVGIDGTCELCSWAPLRHIRSQLAGYLCTSLKLPDDECFDLMLGALGLGFVLALASAIPIFFVCKLQECAKGRNGTTSGGITTSVGSTSRRRLLQQ